MYGFGVSGFLSLLLTSPDCAYILLVQLPEGVVRDVVYWLGYRWRRVACWPCGFDLLGYGGRTMTADRLSQITWNVQEQKAWMQAYRDARRISAARPVKRLTSAELGRWYVAERRARRAARVNY